MSQLDRIPKSEEPRRGHTHTMRARIWRHPVFGAAAGLVVVAVVALGAAVLASRGSDGGAGSPAVESRGAGGVDAPKSWILQEGEEEPAEQLDVDEEEALTPSSPAETYERNGSASSALEDRVTELGLPAGYSVVKVADVHDEGETSAMLVANDADGRVLDIRQDQLQSPKSIGDITGGSPTDESVEYLRLEDGTEVVRVSKYPNEWLQVLVVRPDGLEINLVAEGTFVDTGELVDTLIPPSLTLDDLQALGVELSASA